MARHFDPLESLQYFNFDRFLGMYQGIIELVIYFMIFFSICRAVISRLFSDSPRAANLISIGFGLAFTFGMIKLKSRIGFGLDSFGGIGIVVMMALLYVISYWIFHALGSEAKKAFLWSFLVVFIGMNAVSPQVMGYFVEKFPTLHIVLWIMSMVAFIYLVISVFTKVIPGARIAAVLRPKRGVMDDSGMIDMPGKRELKEEKRAAKEIRKDIISELHEAKEIIHILGTVISSLESDGITAMNKPAIARGVQGVMKAEHELELQLKRQNDFLLSLQSATDPQVQAGVLEFRKREKLAVTLLQNFRYQLQEGISALQVNNAGQAVTHFVSARIYEKRLKSMLKALKKQEERILKLVKKDQKKAKGVK
jgi:hypothetical protein